MTKNEIKLSIIIVNYNVKKELFECLSSIYNSKPKISFEIIIVDNSETKEIQKDLKNNFPKVKYIKNLKNSGYGAGNNLGAKEAKGKYLFILNPDTKFNSGSFSKLISLFESNKKIGIIAPLLLDKKNKPYELQGVKDLTPKRAIFSLSFLVKLFPKNKFYKDYYMLGWNKNQEKEVDVVPGTALIIRRDIFEKIGRFDEKFFLFFEEFDLCKRVKKLGYKILISPDLKFIHLWGESMKKNQSSQEYFKKSRFYYFRKHFGLTTAIFVSLFLNISKTSLLLFCVLVLGFFIRIYGLPDLMTFISDQGWFYLSARDMLLSGNIPLVGITSSHTWLHQGPIWTYILAIALFLGNFNPLAGGYFSVLIDILALFFLYKVSKELFSQEIGLIAALLYATSPLIVMFSRMPYHTSPISLFSILFMLALFRWLKGNVIYFPLLIFICAILYNLELATILFPIIVLIFLFYGLKKKTKWAKIFNFRIIFLSVISFLIPMLPFLYYDLKNGFPQTIKFAGWIFLEALGIFGINIIAQVPRDSWSKFFGYFFGEYYRQIVFSGSALVSLIILLVAIFLNLFFVYKLYKNKNFKENYYVFYICLVVLMLGFVSQRTKSGAYMTMLFPYFILMIAVLAGYLTKISKKIYYLFIVCIVPLFNIFYTLNHYHESRNDGLRKLITESEFIVNDAAGKDFILVKKNFRSNIEIDQYRYLVWWKGGSLKEDSALEYGIYNKTEGEPEKYIYKDNLIYITKTERKRK